MVSALPRDLVARKLAADNPWWVDGAVPDAHLKARRQLEALKGLATRRDVRRAVLLLGPRRVGKTVLLRHLRRDLIRLGEAPTDMLFASLDTPAYSGLGLDDLVDLFRERHGHSRDRALWIVFDEIQYLADWERHLKVLVDKEPTLRILASGSAAAALKRKSQESGAGRFTELKVPPLSFGEFLDMRGVSADPPTGNDTERIAALNRELLDYLNFGGFPEAVRSTAIQHEFQRYVGQDIIDKVLLRDLPSLYGIDDPMELNRFFQHLAYKTGREIAIDGLCKDTGIAKNTIKKYLDYLEAAFLINRLERLDGHAKRFKRATHFKVYLANPSIRAALFGPVDLEDPAFEALVESAALTLLLSTHLRGSTFYARWGLRGGPGDATEGEVDIVSLDATGAVMLVDEIKWSDRIADHPGELRGLRVFAEAQGVDPQCTTRTRFGTSGGIRFRPLVSFLLAREKAHVQNAFDSGFDPFSAQTFREETADAARPATKPV